tara:strand:- start:2043 stop:2558 length:516 start_codon:yes stop_codon:yes gene_type:complete
MPEWSQPANRNHESKQEIHGFRDESISRRHREYGIEISATDIDFVLLEFKTEPDGTYRKGKYKSIPKGLFEYKHWNANRHSAINNASNKALYKLAEWSGLPFFICFYDPDIWCFDVYPFGKKAEHYVERPQRFSEQNFVRLLYKIRMRPPKESIIRKLNDAIHELNPAKHE